MENDQLRIEATRAENHEGRSVMAILVDIDPTVGLSVPGTVSSSSFSRSSPMRRDAARRGAPWREEQLRELRVRLRDSRRFSSGRDGFSSGTKNDKNTALRWRGYIRAARFTSIRRARRIMGICGRQVAKLYREARTKERTVRTSVEKFYGAACAGPRGARFNIN